MQNFGLKISNRFEKKCQKISGGLTHTVGYNIRLLQARTCVLHAMHYVPERVHFAFANNLANNTFC